MKVLNLRKGRIVKIAVIVMFILLFVYILLTNWTFNIVSEKHSKNPKFESLKSKEVPVLVDGFGNFEPENTINRDGPGEGGIAYNLPAEQQNEGSDSEMEYGMNMAVSDAISLDRSVKDTREPECKHWNYPTEMPKVKTKGFSGTNTLF